MMQLANGVREDVTAAARLMLEAGETLAPVLSPDGTKTLHVSTEKGRVEPTLMELEIDGTTVYAGILA